jgi:hypothetical protein
MARITGKTARVPAIRASVLPVLRNAERGQRCNHRNQYKKTENKSHRCFFLAGVRKQGPIINIQSCVDFNFVWTGRSGRSSPSSMAGKKMASRVFRPAGRFMAYAHAQVSCC